MSKRSQVEAFSLNLNKLYAKRHWPLTSFVKLTFHCNALFVDALDVKLCIQEIYWIFNGPVLVATLTHTQLQAPGILFYLDFRFKRYGLSRGEMEGASLANKTSRFEFNLNVLVFLRHKTNKYVIYIINFASIYQQHSLKATRLSSNWLFRLLQVA